MKLYSCGGRRDSGERRVVRLRSRGVGPGGPGLRRTARQPGVERLVLVGSPELPDRVVLFIAGVGFDPRSTAVVTRLAQTGSTVRAVFFKENRRTGRTQHKTRATAQMRCGSDGNSKCPIEPPLVDADG